MSSKTFNNTKINVEFDEDYQSRTNINSGENISSLFAKIRRFILDLKAVCFSGSYNDLSDTPDVVTKEYVDPIKSQAAINRTTLGTQCKNLLKNNAVTQTVSGVTFTINDDKSITVNGTATAQISFMINNKVGLGIGNYILTGCPSGGSWNTFYLTAYASSAWLSAPDFGSGCKIENKTVTQVVISIASGYTANNLKFYPMLRDAEIMDDTYEEYIEDINTVNELHIPNIVTLITNHYREQLVYFEFLDVNGYGPACQHLYLDESKSVDVCPEFLNIAMTDDDKEEPQISIAVY